MASIQKRVKGWRASVCVGGVRDGKVFDTKRDAVDWAQARETELKNIKAVPAGDRTTLRSVLERYSDEVAILHKGAQWERVRIKLFLRQDSLPLDLPVSQVKASHIATFRDERLKTVKPASIYRELNILSAVMAYCKKEWGLVETNVVHDVRKPKLPKHRDRTYTWSEIYTMLRMLGYSPRGEIDTQDKAVALIWLFALRTGMRAGEMTKLVWARVFDRHVHLPDTKNDDTRDVPLSRKALRLLDKMRGQHKLSVFGVSSAVLDSRFRCARDMAGLSGFTFHDSRHTCATWVAGKFKNNKGISAQQAVFDLCKIFGWKDPKKALVYYNPDMSDVASRMD